MIYAKDRKRLDTSFEFTKELDDCASSIFFLLTLVITFDEWLLSFDVSILLPDG